MQKVALRALLALLFCFPLSSFSDDKVDPSTNHKLLGVWQLFDEDLNRVKSKVLFEKNDDGNVSAMVIHLYHPESPDEPLICVECKGDQRNQMIVGMTIIEGLKADEDKWKGGTILNPDTGKKHKISIEIIEEGDKIKLSSSFWNRYKGSKTLGKTLIWER